MKIVIIGSVSFVKEMKEVGERLTNDGHDVTIPPSAELGQNKEYWNNFKEKDAQKVAEILRDRNLTYWKKIKSSDAVLVMNLTKNNVTNYIGPNTLMEIAVAFEHGKKIFLWSDLPGNGFAQDELDYMQPIVINSDLTKIM